MDEELQFYKTNVKFTIGIRFSTQDRTGIVLTPNNPYVGIKKSQIRDFVLANKAMLENGYLIASTAPDIDFTTENAISDEQATELVKSLFALKKKLPFVTSEGALSKLLDEAKAQKRSQKIIDMIQERMEEITPIAMESVE